MLTSKKGLIEGGGRLLCRRCELTLTEQPPNWLNFNDEATRYLSSYSFCLACGWETSFSNWEESTSSELFSVNLDCSLPANEPILHLNKVVDALKIDESQRNFKVLAYGKNSMPFVTAFADIFALNKASRLNSYTTEFSRDSEEPSYFTLHCFIRFLEHVFHPAAILSNNRISDGDYLYIESVDFRGCSNEGDFSYLWNKRIRYVEPVDYATIFSDFSAITCGKITIPRGSDNEPIAGQLFKIGRSLGSSPQVMQSSYAIKHLPLYSTIEKFQMFIRTLSCKLGVVGMGHKGASLAHALNLLGIRGVRYFDDNLSLVSINRRNYLVHPLRSAKGRVLLSTLSGKLSRKLFPDFDIFDEYRYPIIIDARAHG